MAPAPLIEIRHLIRHVHGMTRPLLDIAHMIIGPREQIGLVGPSGSGKSSLLRALVLLDPCKSEGLFFHGERVSSESIPRYRRKVIYLPQRPALVPLSVRDNLRLPFQMKCAVGKFQEQKAVAMLEQIGKPHTFLDQPADALSGGERQIVSLVRAIQLDPQVLLLDEPTASLDAASAEEIEQMVMFWKNGASLEDAGRAFVLVSHDLDQVDRMSDRVMEIHEGKVSGENISHA